MITRAHAWRQLVTVMGPQKVTGLINSRTECVSVCVCVCRALSVHFISLITAGLAPEPRSLVSFSAASKLTDSVCCARARALA